MRPVRLLILLFSICLLIEPSKSQSKSNIVGIWEDAESYGSDARGDIYILKQDRTFRFIFSQYHWAGRRIIAFSGKYWTTNDSIYFQIMETEEIVGGRIENDGPPNGLGWIVRDGQQKVFNQKDNNPVGLGLSCESKDNHDYILIERHKFILVERNPNAKYD